MPLAPHCHSQAPSCPPRRHTLPLALLAEVPQQPQQMAPSARPCAIRARSAIRRLHAHTTCADTLAPPTPSRHIKIDARGVAANSHAGIRSSVIGIRDVPTPLQGCEWVLPFFLPFLFRIVGKYWQCALRFPASEILQ